jgi:hypothetical protein
MRSILEYVVVLWLLARDNILHLTSYLYHGITESKSGREINHLGTAGEKQHTCPLPPEFRIPLVLLTCKWISAKSTLAGENRSPVPY